MSELRVDASELHALAVDLGKISRRSTGVMFSLFEESGRDLRNAWRDNARGTAGEHGKHYPDSITSETRLGVNIEIEIGPDPRLPQGGMSFEYGSANQPPHLDGQLAADTMIPRLNRRVDAALGELGL